jgi:AraC-like DNA-binding protein
LANAEADGYAGRLAMAHRIDVFDDFHLYGASAPEWNQRYAQVSRGLMHSRLTEFVGGQVHVFRKWISERVVQQGGLPRSQLCFALPMCLGDGEPVAQGRSLPMDALLVLRGGAEFTIQRPRNMELLAVTVDSDGFWSHLDAAKLAIPRRATESSVLRTSSDAADDLRARVLALLTGAERGPAAPALVLDALIQSLAAAVEVTPSIGHATAAYLLAETHRMVVEAAPGVPSVAEVCARLRVSRRTLQNSFHLLAGTTPLDFMRAIRLNAVRDRLRGSGHVELTVGQAASDWGFDHLSHFAERYGALFGELPSRTPRMARIRSSTKD